MLPSHLNGLLIVHSKTAMSDIPQINIANILQSPSLPREFSNYTLPRNKYQLFLTPLLDSIQTRDPTFHYLPVINRFQFCTKNYCDYCLSLLNNSKKYQIGGNTLHLSTPHNIPCPNNKCHQ